MSAAETIRQLLREKPRAVSELAQMVYGPAYGTPRSQVHNRLRYMIAQGQVRAERTGQASNALVIYHWVEQPEAAATPRADLIQELKAQLPVLQSQLQMLAHTAGELRRFLERDNSDSAL